MARSSIVCLFEHGKVFGRSITFVWMHSVKQSDELLLCGKKMKFRAFISSFFMSRLTDFTMESQVEVVRTLLSRGINPSLKDQHDRYWQGSSFSQKKECEVVGFMKRTISIL